MAKFDPLHRQNPLSRLPKNVMGDQVRGETRYAKFSADQCTGVFGGDMPIYRLSFFVIYRVCLFPSNVC